MTVFHILNFFAGAILQIVPNKTHRLQVLVAQLKIKAESRVINSAGRYPAKMTVCLFVRLNA